MKLPHRRELGVIRYQLSKSACSIGANYEEAQSSSEKEFVQKLKIALREANELKYWYKIIERLEIIKTDDL
jgi:four helix bundle protein